METVEFVPGATTTLDPLTLPTTVPDIDAVISATIMRGPKALADHPAADVLACINNHAGADVLGAIADHPAAFIEGALADHSAILMAAAVADHPTADVVDAVLDHPVHAHDLEVETGAVVEAFGAAGAGQANLTSASGQTIPGGVVATGIQDIGAAQAHAAGANPLVHAGAADVAHVAGAAAVPHTAGANPVVHGNSGTDLAHAGGDPVVAGIPTKLTTRTLTLSVDTLLGDVLILFYYAVGERVAAR